MSSANRKFQVGESVTCPACGQSSVVKITTKMAGWKPVGQIFVCALCSAELGPVESQAAHESTASDSASVSRLAHFLAEKPKESVKADLVLDVAEDLGRFCKNCRQFYKHPFIDKCLLHKRPTGPMDDCSDFDPQPANENE